MWIPQILSRTEGMRSLDVLVMKQMCLCETNVLRNKLIAVKKRATKQTYLYGSYPISRGQELICVIARCRASDATMGMYREAAMLCSE